MVTALETNITTSLLYMFGGNMVLLGITFLAILVGAILITRMPLIIASPMLAMAFILIGAMIPGFIVFLGLGVGVMIAYFVYMLWTGR